MNAEEKTMFERALRQTRLVHVVDTLACLLASGVALLVAFDPTASSGELVAVSLLAALMAMFGLSLGYRNVVRASAKLSRLLRALELSPHDVVGLDVSVRGTRRGRRVTLTEADALTDPPASGAQWRVEVRLRDEAIGLIPGEEQLARGLAAAIRRRAPHLAGA
jgi:hypothetical protein